jgi:hypothetical protein
MDVRAAAQMIVFGEVFAVSLADESRRGWDSTTTADTTGQRYEMASSYIDEHGENVVRMQCNAPHPICIWIHIA